MARTNADDVEAILGDHYDGVKDLAPFINTATIRVDRMVTCATSKGITHTAAELVEIEKYLAAHAYWHADQMYTSKSTDRASGSFQGQTGKGLEASHYGQTALELDHSGCLAAAFNKARAGMIWLGKPPSDQIDYNDRD